MEDEEETGENKLVLAKFEVELKKEEPEDGNGDVNMITSKSSANKKENKET